MKHLCFIAGNCFFVFANGNRRMIVWCPFIYPLSADFFFIEERFSTLVNRWKRTDCLWVYLYCCASEVSFNSPIVLEFGQEDCLLWFWMIFFWFLHSFLTKIIFVQIIHLLCCLRKLLPDSIRWQWTNRIKVIKFTKCHHKSWGMKSQ